MKIEMVEKREWEFMEAKLFNAVVEGDVSILSETSVENHGEAFFLGRSPNENNILHIAAEHAHLNFFRHALNRFRTLVHQKYENNDTPLHIAASKGSAEIIELMLSFLDQITTAAATIHDSSNATVTPMVDDNSTTTTAEAYLLAKNKQGETAVHVAFMSKNIKAARELSKAISRCPEICRTLNNSRETPLHVFVRYCAFGILWKQFCVWILMQVTKTLILLRCNRI